MWNQILQEGKVWNIGTAQGQADGSGICAVHYPGNVSAQILGCSLSHSHGQLCPGHNAAAVSSTSGEEGETYI